MTSTRSARVLGALPGPTATSFPRFPDSCAKSTGPVGHPASSGRRSSGNDGSRLHDATVASRPGVDSAFDRLSPWSTPLVPRRPGRGLARKHTTVRTKRDGLSASPESRGRGRSLLRSWQRLAGRCQKRGCNPKSSCDLKSGRYTSFVNGGGAGSSPPGPRVDIFSPRGFRTVAVSQFPPIKTVHGLIDDHKSLPREGAVGDA